MKIHKFEELQIWQSSIQLAKDIYEMTSHGSFARDFGLRDQIRRAIVSVSSNIVEGFEKNSNNEFIRFLKIAKGSAGEARNQLHRALAVKYIVQKDAELLMNELEKLSGQIGAFISYLEKKRKEKEFIK